MRPAVTLVCMTASTASFWRCRNPCTGSVLLRTNRDGSGWMVCNREGTTVYCELRLTDPAKETQTPDIDGEQTEAGEYRRIANIGSQQLQARVVTPYYGLSIDDIIHGTTVFR